jgi:hypothetical protein
MAVEIKELIIKAVVSGENAAASGGDDDKAQLVQQCVDQVLKILKKTTNR